MTVCRRWRRWRSFATRTSRTMLPPSANSRQGSQKSGTRSTLYSTRSAKRNRTLSKKRRLSRLQQADPAADGDTAVPAAAFAAVSMSEPADRARRLPASPRQRRSCASGSRSALRPISFCAVCAGVSCALHPRLGDSTLLEAPPTELRQKVKRLALAKRWRELLDACEQAMALPGSRAWLDLQRLSVAACSALGSEYQPIATAIQSELRALLNDLPELLDATLLDDTPAANPETKAWLQHLQDASTLRRGPGRRCQCSTSASLNGTPTWLAQAADAYVLAKEALAAGQEEKAFAIMRGEIARQRSGRGRFRRTMQMIDLAVSAGKDAIAQPLLEDVAAMIENHKLDAWEDPEQMASDLIKLMRNSKKIQGSSSDKQKMFERICRLDPVQALSVG